MKRLIAAIAVLALAAPAVASAQSRHGGGHNGGGSYSGQHSRSHTSGARPGGGSRYNGSNRSGGSRYNGSGRSGGARYTAGNRSTRGYSRQGWRGDRNWRGGNSYRSSSWYNRGSYLPTYYSSYVVNDWSRYHLRQPPRGYYWYRTGNDFVLAAIATGLIYDLATSGSYGDYGYSYDYPGDYDYAYYDDGYSGYGY